MNPLVSRILTVFETDTLDQVRPPHEMTARGICV